ncbi:MAG: MBG domain-containing protein [Bacteroidota bacterium]
MTKSTLFFCFAFIIAQLSLAQVTTFSDNGTLTNTVQTAIEFDNASLNVRSTATATIPLLSTGASSITFTLKGGDGGTATWDGAFTDLTAQGGEGGTVTFTMPITPENEGKRITFYQGKHGGTEFHPIIASGGGGASTALLDHNGTLLALAGGGGGGCAVENYQSSGRPGGVATPGHATSCVNSGNAGVDGTTGSNTPESLGGIVAQSSETLSVYAGGGGGLSGISRRNSGIHSGDITGKAASDGGWGGYHPEGIFYSGPNCNQDFPFQIPGCTKTETRDRSRGGTGYSGGGAGGPWLRDSFRSSCSERMWSLFGAGGGGGGYDGGGAGSPERGGGGGSSYVDPAFTNPSFQEGGYVTNSRNGSVVYQVNYDNQPPVAVCKDVILFLGQGNYITNDGQIGIASGVNGQATLDPAAIDGGSLDDVFIEEMTTSKNTFTCADLGENTVTLTVKDGNDNTASCSAQVTVVDNFAPTITSATSRIINAPDFGNIDLGFRASVTITPPELDFVDNCGVASVVQAEPFTVTCSDIGTSIVKEVVATDASGNQNVVYLTYNITSNFINTSTIYVNANQPDDNGDGLSWATAKKYLNSALAMLDGSACYNGKQIWVAGGTYYPDEGTNQTDNDRHSTFLLGNGVAIYGGFSGNETSLDQRDYAKNPTILSGDLQQDDQAGLNNSDNAYTVVSSLNTLPFIMDGFIISGGNSNGPTYETSVGGGVACNSSSSFRNCIFSGNTANLAGGAFFSINAEVEFINCIFSGNTADIGGAIYSDVSSLSLINSTLSGNSASTDGGAISSLLGSTLAVKNSIIWNNRAQGATTSPSASISGNATYSNSLVANISSSGIVSNADPLFVEGIDFTTEALPTTAGDFHAQLGIVRDAGDKSYNTLEKDLDGKARTLGQIDLGPYEYGYSPDYFVTTWRTTTVNETIELPLVEGYWYFIDWDNDGIIDNRVRDGLETNTRGRIHTFATPGIHTIVISPLTFQLDFKDFPDKDKIVSIEQWGDYGWRSMNNAFNGCSNLVINAKDTPNLIRAEDLSYMFAGATSLDYDFSQWDVSTVTNMQGMFDGVTLSEENYDKLLNSWSNLGVKRDVVFSAGNSNYCLGEPGRTKLIESFGWEITDGGSACGTVGCTDDKTPPEPDLLTLPNIAAECEVTGLTAPTATDDCTTRVRVTHDANFPITKSTIVTWTYADASGNLSTQMQNVVIKDFSAPVPDLVTLPEVTAEAPVTELTPPTATDNCTASVTVTHNAVFPINENTLVTWTYTDAAGNFSTQSQNVVIKKGTAPVVTLPAIIGVQEDIVYDIPDAIHVTDPEGDDLILTFTVTGGSLSIGTTGITFGGLGNGSASFTASGTLANLNTALDAATFLSSPNLNGAGAGSIAIVANDGNSDSDTAFVIFDIDAINDDPAITGLPSSITVKKDATEDPFDISAATISDVDAGNGELTLKLRAVGGVFDYAGGTGITPSGQLSTEATFTGSLTDLNNYINIPTNIYFRPDANLSGDAAASVEVSINDNGNTGSNGGTDILIATIEINITPVNDAPTVANAIPDQNAMEGVAFNFQFASNTFEDIDVGDVMTYTAELNDGSPLPAWLVFDPLTRTFSGTPLNDNIGIMSIDVIANDGKGGSVTDTFTLTVNPGITFEDVSFDFDGTEKTISISGTLPEGATVAYTNNGRTNVGYQEVIATISGDNFSTLILTANLTITPAIIAGISFVDADFEFDGNEKSLAISGTLPEGASVAYTNNGRTQVGSQEVTATISGVNFQTLVLKAQLTVLQEGCLTKAAFRLSPAEACSETITVFFTDLSTDVDTWFWEFGNGGTSTAKNPIFSYTSFGEFTVRLTASNSVTGCSSITEKVFSNQPVSADFTANTTFGCGPLTVDFEDRSEGATSWNWDFGDGTTSTEQNPSHTYQSPGTFTVSLSVNTGSTCTDSMTKTNYVQVIGPDLEFSVDKESGNGPLEVQFTDNSISSAPLISRLWNFGDGSTSSSQNPTHTYSNGGLYTVSLTVSYLDGCSMTLTKTDFIEVFEVELSTTVSNVSCFDGSDGSASVTASGGLAPYTYLWSNDETDATINGLEAGNYSVTVTDSRGLSKSIDVIISQPVSVSIQTSIASTITSNSAELGGEIITTSESDQAACITEYGVVYSTTTNPDISDFKVVMSSGEGSFSELVTGLQLNTTYYVKAFATNQNGFTTYGDEVAFTTSRKILTITVDPNQSKEYGEADPTFTYEAIGFDSGDDESILTGELKRAAGAGVGTYAINLGTLDAGPNYTINFMGADFEITPATLNVSVFTGQQKTYGDPDRGFRFFASGFTNGDFGSIITGTLSRAPGEDVGAYPINLGTVSAGDNYTINFTGADFVITPAALTITADADQNKTYGDADPTFTYQATGFENGDDESILTGALSRAAGENVGNYAINQGSLDAGDNYTINYTGADFEITERTLTVIADANQGKVYGQADPVLTYTASNFGNGDDESIFTGSLVRAAGENVGSYAINQGSLDAGDNYTINYTGADFAITKKTLTITADANQSKVYGDSDPTFTYQATGFENGDDESILTGALSRAAGENVGSYAINLGSVSAGDNYIINFVGADFVIIKKALTITADDKQKIYGEANPTLTFTYTGLVNGDTKVSEEPSISTTATASSNVGEYPIELEGGSDQNYAITLVNGTLTIGKKDLTITADDKQKTYGEANPTLTFTYTGLVNGDTKVSEEPSISTTATASSNVGEYPIELEGGADQNYAITLVNGTLTIGKKDLTITAEDKQKTYGEANPTLTFTYTGLVNGDTKVATEPSISTIATASSNVGDYPITLTGGEDQNYAITLVNGTLTVGKKDLTITADDKQKTYGEANPILTFTYTGLVNGDTKVATEPSISTTATASSNVGDYPITLTGGSDQNYAITLVDGMLTIGKKDLTITAEDKQKIYGEANPTLTFTYTGLVNGDTKVATEPSISTTATASSNVGDYPITLTGGFDQNYAITLIDGTLTIGKKDLTITAEDKQKIYGEANPILTFTYTGLVNGDTKVATEPSISTTATASSNVGTYPIELEGGVDQNYAITLIDGTLTIGKKDLTITAEDKQKIYGEANPTLTFTYTGLVNGDTKVATEPSISTTATASSNVGDYPITLTGGSDQNYAITLIDGTLTIGKKDLTITAEDKQKTYGEENPILTFTYTGLVNGDTKVATEPSISTTATASSNVGEYPIELAGGSDQNYEIKLVDGTLTIGKKDLTITADDKQKTYGEENPSLIFTYTGLVNGDTKVSEEPSISTTATASSNVGEYPIELVGGSDQNYAITLVSGTLTIGKKDLTITAEDKQKIYGEANPTLTFTYTGLVNGDTDVAAEPSISTTASASSNVGYYPITLTGGSDQNYAITLVDGTLTIGKKDLTITAEDKQKIFGREDPVLTYTVDGLTAGDGESIVTGTLSRESGEEVGTYGITQGSLDAGDNYTITYTGAELEIVPAVLLLINNPELIQTPWSVMPELPATVIILTADGQEVEIGVNWDESSLNLLARGVYSLFGSLQLPEGIENESNEKAVLQVEVLAKPAPQDLTLSNNSFDPSPTVFFQEVGAFTVIDLVDDIHEIALVAGAADNEYFEIIDGILFWSSADQASGRTEFTIKVSVTDRDGNVLEKDFVITRTRLNLESLEVFNTFTPNGDGVNDSWGLPALRYYQGVRLQVFDLSGERLFYSEDADVRWDGTYKGKEMPTGAYTWVIEVIETGEKRMGVLNLIRN